MARSRISRTLRDDAAVARVASILSRDSFDSRSAFGRRVCEEFSLVDCRGHLQLAGCMKALGALAGRAPDIVLPPPRAPAVDNRPRLPETAFPEAQGVPEHPTLIRDLEVRLVTGTTDRALWNTLIATGHPHGMTIFAGCQARYLVGSSHGWPGATGFPAAAFRLAARDRRMSREDEQRRDHLHRVVCLSCFLVRPQNSCPHLASHLLGRLLRRLPGDFEARYGYRPYPVESLADRGVNGTCLGAADFLRVGQTDGRGRQDRENRQAKTVKTVFMRGIERGWRRARG